MTLSAEKTSSGLLALVVGALSECAPDLLPPGIAMPDCALAHAPAAPKRELLATTLEQLGPGFVLGMGQRVKQMGFEPVLHVLLRSETPEVLVAKWQRFEQFTHSNHRTAVVAGDHSLDLKRHGLSGGSPTAGENLLIYGLLIALLEEVGCEGVTAELAGEGEPLLVVDAGKICLVRESPVGATDRLIASWTGFERRLRAAPAHGGVAEPRTPLLFYGGDERTPYARRAASRLAGDVGRGWSLNGLAKDLGVSGRTLQRRLAEEGTSLTELTKAVRIREACHLLAGSGLSLTEIGYWCGFSDGPHFSREFRRALGMTPATYRRTAA